MRKETVLLGDTEGKPVQTGWHRTKQTVKQGRKKVLVKTKFPVFKGLDASFARYLRAQKKRLVSGKRCNVTPGYVK